jgi:hypothetical protein
MEGSDNHAKAAADRQWNRPATRAEWRTPHPPVSAQLQPRPQLLAFRADGGSVEDRLWLARSGVSDQARVLFCK